MNDPESELSLSVAVTVTVLSPAGSLRCGAARIVIAVNSRVRRESMDGEESIPSSSTTELGVGRKRVQARPMGLDFSRRAALVAGIVMPLLETWRRWGEWGQLAKLPSILDDFLAGGFLILGAVMSHRHPTSGRAYLAAAWGVATGMMYYSFFGQLILLGQPDPSGVSSAVVVAFKGLLFAGCVLCLAGALRVPREPVLPERG